jgi:hypothetical protein
MSDFQIKDGTFSMFKVTEKKKDSSPDFTGKGMFCGKEFRLSAWTKMKKDGTGAYISGYIEEPRPADTPATPQQTDDFMMTPAVKSALDVQEPVMGATVKESVEEPDDLPF